MSKKRIFGSAKSASLKHGFKYSRHGFFLTKHGRACRQVIFGPGLGFTLIPCLHYTNE